MSAVRPYMLEADTEELSIAAQLIIGFEVVGVQHSDDKYREMLPERRPRIIEYRVMAMLRDDRPALIFSVCKTKEEAIDRRRHFTALMNLPESTPHFLPAPSTRIRPLGERQP